MSNMDQLVTTGLYIDGQVRPAADGAVYDIRNPARPEMLAGQTAAATARDVDDAAFTRMYWGAFASSGQICMALKRMNVHESRCDEVLDGFTAACDRAVIGDGLLPETTMGPVNNAPQLKVVTDMIAEARAKGAKVRQSGQVPDEALYRGGGDFQKPALVHDADPALSIVKDEQFGPALPIMKFATEDAAVAMANDSDYGLCSSVWTDDAARAARIARRIEAGYTYLNNHGPTAQDGRGPFGGFKLSGVGCNLGYDSVLAFAEPHSISGPAGFLLGE